MTTSTQSEISSTLISYAFLKISNQDNNDYFDYFKPFIKQVLYDYELSIVTANDVQPRLEQNYKIKLPIHVIKTILKRLEKENILANEDRKYKILKENIDVSTFNHRKQVLLTQHSVVIEKFKTFAFDVYKQILTYVEAEEALSQLISQKSTQIIKREQVETTVKQEDFNKQRGAILAARFVKSIIQEDEIAYNHLIEIVKGHMLMQAIYMADNIELDKMNMKIKNTQFYFDTTFIMYALGFSGEVLKNTCIELLKLLEGSNAQLCLFETNLNEARGILEYSKNNINKPSVDKHNTVTTFIENGWDASDIDEIIINLDKLVENELKIKIVTHIPYNEYTHVIDHTELTDFLRNSIRYRSERALENDVESITAITRIRKGKLTTRLEDCQALFVTTNYHLAKYSDSYFNAEQPTKIITPVIYDGYLTNLMWLKNPQISPDLPKSILVADCYAAVQPSEGFWNRCMALLDVLVDTGQITKDKVFDFKYSQGFNDALMDMFMGDEEVVSIGDIQTIIATLEAERTLEKEQLIKEERQKAQAKQKELESEIESEKERASILEESNREKDLEIENTKKKNQEVFETIARNRARSWKWILEGIISVIVVIVAASVTVYTSSFERIGQFVVAILLVGVPLVFTILGLTCKSIFNKFEDRMYKKILGSLEKLK